VSFFVDLAADVCDLRTRGRVENVRKIVDVARGLQLRNRFCPSEHAERQNKDCHHASFCAQIHRQIVQESACAARIRVESGAVLPRHFQSGGQKISSPW
jgi:hypothetical protein